MPISAHAPSFMPQHLTGPNAGGTACPLCIYGMVPQVQIWTDEDHLEEALKLAKRLDPSFSIKPIPNRTVGYVVVSPNRGKPLSSAARKQIQSARLTNAFVTAIPSLTDAQTGRLYGNSWKDWPGVRAYALVNRRVYRRWDRPTMASAGDILAAVRQGRPHVRTHEIADSQITPPWEPGQRMEIVFRIVDSSGKPMPRIKVSAAQTGRDGLYNPRGWNRREMTLTALAWTDSKGEIVWRTIMPGPYPTRTEPAHIHYTATVEGKPKWRTLWFEGDPLLTSERRAWAERDAETVIVPLDKSRSLWKVVHTFQID